MDERFDQEQRARVAALAERMYSDPRWRREIPHLEASLRVALEVTASDFVRWVEDSERHYDDVLAAPDEAMADQARLALVARLLRDIADSYGLRTEYSEGRLAQEEGQFPSLAWFVRGLTRVASRLY